MAFNKTVLMGRLTNEPTIRETSNGTAVANFTLAVDRGFGENKQTDFFPIVAFKGTAETIAKHVGKGQLILVCGQLQTRSWEDSDGNKRTTTEIVATEFSFCETKKTSETESSSDVVVAYTRRNTPSQTTMQEIDDNELPF